MSDCVIREHQEMVEVCNDLELFDPVSVVLVFLHQQTDNLYDLDEKLEVSVFWLLNKRSDERFQLGE